MNNQKNHVVGTSCLHRYDGMCSPCAAKHENDLRDAKALLGHVKSKLDELDKLEKLSHEIRDKVEPRIGLGDGERTSLEHARIIKELKDELISFAVPEAPIFDQPRPTERRCERYGLADKDLRGVSFCDKGSARAVFGLVEELRAQLKEAKETAEEERARAAYVWAYPAAKTLKDEVDRLTARVKALEEEKA